MAELIPWSSFRRLRCSMRQRTNLVRYVERLHDRFFDGPATLLEAVPMPPVTSSAVPQQSGAEENEGRQAKSSRTPKQQRFKDRSRNALLAAAGSMLLYVAAMTDVREDLDEAYDSDE